jgi:hypothetical protein
LVVEKERRKNGGEGRSAASNGRGWKGGQFPK